MHLDNKGTVKLSELIQWVKKEIWSEESLKEDTLPMFVIDEVTVEVSFVLSGEGGSGFDLQVVSAEAKIAEERIQKATIRMKPLVPYEQIRERLKEKNLRHFEDKLVRILVKNIESSEPNIPERK